MNIGNVFYHILKILKIFSKKVLTSYLQSDILIMSKDTNTKKRKDKQRMAEKMITRSIVSAYNYKVYTPDQDGNLTIAGTIKTDKVATSTKAMKELLIANKFTGSETLMLADADTVKYEISEEDFIKYGKKVEEKKDEKKEEVQ